MDIIKDDKMPAGSRKHGLLGPNKQEELFRNIHQYIGIQSIENDMLRKSIQKALKELPEIYTTLQKKAQKTSVTGNNEIRVSCSEITYPILSSYSHKQYTIGGIRSSLKKSEIEALRRITKDIFGCITKADATLSTDPDTHDIIVRLPYDVAENVEHDDEEIDFWYKISLATQKTRKHVTYKGINIFIDNLENQLKKLSQQKYKKEIGGILGSLVRLVTSSPSRTVEVSDPVAAALTKVYRKASGGLPHSQKEREEYHAYVESRLASLSQEYGCTFKPYTQAGEYRNKYYIAIEPDRSMDETHLIS